MSKAPSRIGMILPHPGEFVRDEILNELGLSVSEAADVLGVRRATLSDLKREGGAVPRNGVADREGFRREDGNAALMQTWHDAHAMRAAGRARSTLSPTSPPPAPEPR